MTDARESGHPDDPLCAFCGGAVPAMGAIIYHGVVYHPACVAPTTKRRPVTGAPSTTSERPRPA